MGFGSEMFFAGLASRRGAETNEAVQDTYDWADYAQRLEARLERVNEIAQAWQDEAIDNGAHSYVANQAFKEVNGKSVRDHYGNDEMERRLQGGRKLISSEYGV